MQTIIFILPEILLSLSIMTLLMIGVFLKKKAFRLINLLTVITLLFAAALVLNQSTEIGKIFDGSYVIDSLSIFMKALTLFFCLCLQTPLR